MLERVFVMRLLLVQAAVLVLTCVFVCEVSHRVAMTGSVQALRHMTTMSEMLACHCITVAAEHQQWL